MTLSRNKQNQPEKEGYIPNRAFFNITELHNIQVDSILLNKSAPLLQSIGCSRSLYSSPLKETPGNWISLNIKGNIASVYTLPSCLVCKFLIKYK